MNRKHYMKQWLALLLSLLLCLPAAALADLKKGDRGDEVKETQRMLIELGFLNDKADGIFGRKTAEAVKRLQRYLGEEQTGVLTEEQGYSLLSLYMTAEGAMEDDGLGEDELMEIYPHTCSHTGEGGHDLEYCYRHLEQAELARLLTMGEMPSALATKLSIRLRDRWQRDIRSMYEEWEEALPEEEKHIAREQRDQFESSLADMRLEWAAVPGTNVLLQEALWLDVIGAELCFDLHGAEPNDE